MSQTRSIITCYDFQSWLSRFPPVQRCCPARWQTQWSTWWCCGNVPWRHAIHPGGAMSDAVTDRHKIIHAPLARERGKMNRPCVQQLAKTQSFLPGSEGQLICLQRTRELGSRYILFNLECDTSSFLFKLTHQVDSFWVSVVGWALFTFLEKCDMPITINSRVLGTCITPSWFHTGVHFLSSLWCPGILLALAARNVDVVGISCVFGNVVRALKPFNR